MVYHHIGSLAAVPKDNCTPSYKILPLKTHQTRLPNLKSLIFFFIFFSMIRLCSIINCCFHCLKGTISSPECVRCSTSTLGYKRPFGNLIDCSPFCAITLVLCWVNGRGVSKFVAIYLRNSKNNKPFHFRSCGESFSNLQLRPMFAPNKSSLFSH